MSDECNWYEVKLSLMMFVAVVGSVSVGVTGGILAYLNTKLPWLAALVGVGGFIFILLLIIIPYFQWCHTEEEEKEGEGEA